MVSFSSNSAPLFCSVLVGSVRFGSWSFLTWTRPHCLLHFCQLKALLQMQFSSVGIWVKLHQIKYNSARGPVSDSHAKESVGAAAPELEANHYYFYVPRLDPTKPH